MKSDIDVLVELNKSQIPKELVEAATAAATAHVTEAPAISPATGEDVDNTSDSVIGIVDDDDMIVEIAPLLQWQSAAWPPSMVPPRSQAIYPADLLGQRFVGFERIGMEPVFPPLPDLKGMSTGHRGRDQKKTKQRTCARCK